MNLRAQQLKRLHEETFDVLIIGCGINGAATAAALSARGVKTALVDRGDFGGCTSQSSSNLIWGGIKYLESMEIGLVRELCRSRNKLIQAYPTYIREIRFLTHLEQGFRFPAFLIYSGALLYWLMGFFQTRVPRFFTRSAMASEEPLIKTAESIGGVEYSDAYLVEHDARFVLQFVRRSLKEGCAAVNYVSCLKSSRSKEGIWETRMKEVRSGDEWTLRSRILINACGPFVDRQNDENGLSSSHRHVFSKGIHLVVPRLTKKERVLAFFADDGRLFFAIPMSDRTVIGTTDTRVPEPETAVTEADRQFILDNINKRLNLKQPLSRKDILSERCGVRPLVLESE